MQINAKWDKISLANDLNRPFLPTLRNLISFLPTIAGCNKALNVNRFKHSPAVDQHKVEAS